MRKSILFLTVSVIILGSIFLNACNEQMQNISPEEKLYRSKCSSCHSTLIPSEYDYSTWNEYTEKYGKNLTQEEKQLLRQYHGQGP